MKQWESSNPVGTVPGDALPGAPELARRGNITTGYRELDLVHPGSWIWLQGSSRDSGSTVTAS